MSAATESLAGRLLRLVRRSNLIQAGLAIGVAGLGRIALNSVLSVGFGHERFAAYAALNSAIMLWASLASAGPSAAVTLTISRSLSGGGSPRSLLRLLAALTGLALLAALALGAWTLGNRTLVERVVWGIGVVLVVLYQAARALGYAVRRAATITMTELAGALVPLAAAGGLLAFVPDSPVSLMVLAFVLGPLTFLLVFTTQVGAGLPTTPGPVPPELRRLACRASIVFFFGAGSSMAMQYLPVILAGRLQATTVVAVMFGSLQATTPLLLFSRVYGTIKMPELAAREGEPRTRFHSEVLTQLRVPTLAVALGLAPWVVLSLGVRPDAGTISVAALVAMVVLMSVWATPAVTLQSSRDQELIPAACSVGGFLTAGAVWVVATRSQAPILFPVGLALGAVVRSLVPLWLFTRQGGPPAHWARYSAGALLVTGVLCLATRQSPPVALALGAALMAGGGWAVYRGVKRLARDAHPAR